MAVGIILMRATDMIATDP